MKKIILFFLLSTFFTVASAQTHINKTITETCDCVKKIDKTLSEDDQVLKAVDCMSQAMENNVMGLIEDFNITSNDPQQVVQEIGLKMSTKLLSACPEVSPYLMRYVQKKEAAVEGNVSINPDTLKLDKKICDGYFRGKFKFVAIYINNTGSPISDETAYFEFKDGFQYGYYENGRYHAKWSFKKINMCEWEQSLLETNEPTLNAAMKKGDKTILKAVGSSPNGDIWVTSTISGFQALIQMRKIK